MIEYAIKKIIQLQMNPAIALRLRFSGKKKIRTQDKVMAC